ncbi:TPM domain-containing protein [soil metagenome]
MTLLTQDDHARIAQAVGAAEAKTTGEIVCIITKEVSEYRETPLAWAAAAALLLPPIAVLMGFDPSSYIPRTSWSAAGATPPLIETIALYAAVQGVVLVAVVFVVMIPAVRRAVTPGTLKAHRVHKAAMTQFLATGIASESNRTGVVIFASMADRKVEVLADKGIHDAVGDAVWARTVEAVQAGMKRGEPGAGFVAAVGICGEALAQHFPSTGPRANALADGPIEL